MGKTFLIKNLENNLKAYDNIRKIMTGQGDDYTAGCLLYYVLIAIDLSKQQTLFWCKSNTRN